MALTQTDFAAALQAQGEQQIARNCGECLGATESGLKEGMSKLLLSTIIGGEDAQLLRKLVGVVQVLQHVYAEPDSDEYAFYRNLHRALLKRIVDVAPNDLESAYELALSEVEAEKQLASLKDLIRRRPDYIPAKYAAAKVMLESNVELSVASEYALDVAKSAELSRLEFYMNELSLLFDLRELPDVKRDMLMFAAERTGK